MKLFSVFLLALLFSATLYTAGAVEYDVVNNAVGTTGGDRFNSEIGIDYAKEVLSSASSFIWSTFQQSETDRKDVQLVTLTVVSGSACGTVACTYSNSKIDLGSDYVGSYEGDVTTEITGVLYHEDTHVWQWNGQGTANGGLIEGVADYVRLKAGYAPSHWGNPGEGERWDQGYDVTAYFLDYCESLLTGFVAQLNAKMKDGYSDDFFVELLGNSVDQLWADYKAKYST